MAFNPMKTRKEWQAIKKKYGIPDRVIKSGSFGEKSEKLAKKFDSLGLGNVSIKNGQAGIAFATEAEALLEEWLVGARKQKASAFTDQAGALETVTTMKRSAGMIRTLAQAKLNPIAMSKANWKNFDKLWKLADADRADTGKSQAMYAQGIRNYIGQGFHDAYKVRDVLNFSSALTGAIVRYEKLAARWDPLNGDSSVLEDVAIRAKFWKDMTELRSLGEKIIEVGV